MKKKLLSLVLAAVLLFSLSTGALATNTLGVSWSAVLNTATVSNETDQTVTVTLTPNKPITVSACDYVIEYPSVFTITGISGSDAKAPLTATDYNLNFAAGKAKVSWTSSDTENVIDVASLGTASFTVPAGTTPGSYTFTISAIEASKDYGDDIWEKNASATVTLTVTGEAAASDYTAAMGSDQSILLDESAQVQITVASENEETFNACYFELEYDDEKLEYVSASDDVTVEEAAPGELAVTLYGAEKAIPGTVTLTFKGIDSGEAAVELKAANIDKAANALAKDAPAASITDNKTVVTVGGYAVQLSNDFSGDSSAAKGGNYTFTAKDKNYNYTVSATMGGAAVKPIDNGDGSYTVKNVSGKLVITATKAPKTFAVSKTGEATLTDGETATYLTDYHFSRGNDDGYNYTVAVTIGGTAYTGSMVNGADYTIPGADITGNIAITVTKEVILPDNYAVSVSGSGAGDASAPTQAAREGDAVLTLTPAEGYDYTVTATMGGATAEVKVSGNTYTVEGVSGDVVFTVTKIGKMDAAVYEYLKLGNGKSLWLVTASGTLEAGDVFSYDGSAMFYSTKYQAYCWLTISDDSEANVKAAATALIGRAKATAEQIAYDGDVNQTKLTDVNDAQLVWNMYNGDYVDFTVCSMLKFFSADVNGDKTVNTQDAAAIISTVTQ